MNINVPKSVEWNGDGFGCLKLIDQTLLPGDLSFVECSDVESVYEAIQKLKVRGAPAIGIAAAYGVLVGLQTVDDEAADQDQWKRRFDQVCDYLAASRPTAVNLFWAIDRMKSRFTAVQHLAIPQARQALLEEAHLIRAEDQAMCHAIGKHGAELLGSVSAVLTHCNTGGLATAEYGTALSVLFTAQDMGKELHVYVDETRPLLQGARLTTWELMQRAIPHTLICDSMAAHVMRAGKVQAVITGADRITANGDTANKIGTYSLAVLARAHQIPFYVAAPSSTFDLSLTDGNQIPIEERSAEEITEAFGKRTAPLGVQVYNPAFDVTPADLITAIITEKGIIQPVDQTNVRQQLGHD